jgi:peptide/nickel transport system substrate-binding protein
MEKLKRCNAIVAVLGMLLLVLVPLICLGSAPAPGVKPRYGGTLRISDRVDEPLIGYPPKMSKPVALRQAAPAIETLLRNDKTGRLVPWLATGFKEDSKTKTITLTLRKGVKFHDGTDFNAEAVKWNLDQSIAAHAAGTDKLKSIDAIDNYTVQLNLTSWDSTVSSNLAQFLGMMISPTAYKKNGEDWCQNNPVGTGPFQIVSRQKDVHTSYKKFDGYWQKGKPYVDRIEFLSIADTLIRELSLKKGEVDVIMAPSLKNLEAFQKDGYVTIRVPAAAGARVLVPDSARSKSPFANLKVRQAAQYAIDSDAIVKSIFSGYNESANQEIYKGHWAYNTKVVGYPYNPAKARQLLAEAGYPNGFKTKLTYMTTAENDQVFTAVQGYLKAVGIDAELDVAQVGKWNSVITGTPWEGLWMGISSGSPDPVTLLVQFYAGTNPAFSQMLVPEDYSRAVQNAVGAPDFKTKQKWTREAMKLLTDKYALMLMVYYQWSFAVGQSYVRDHGILQSANTVQWTPETVWLAK